MSGQNEMPIIDFSGSFSTIKRSGDHMIKKLEEQN